MRLLNAFACAKGFFFGDSAPLGSILGPAAQRVVVLHYDLHDAAARCLQGRAKLVPD